MAKASEDYKAMKQFMVSKILPMQFTEDWKLQGIDHTAYRIDDAADEQPEERLFGQTL